MATKYVIVCGGVISGVGKGIVAASIAKILQEYGFSVCPIKIDPYINIDAGTMRPTEHGEVWVTDDGGEIDQDLGNYERFLEQDISKTHNITTGQVYKAIIERERAGGYLGKTVEFIPHVPEEVMRRFKEASAGYDVAVIEVGGTVGDFENIPFLFATKSLEREHGREHVVHSLVTFLPVPTNLGEAKTKPTQQAIKHLTECGIFPDFIFCRSKEQIDTVRRKKIETYANMPSDHIISSPDVSSIYSVPLLYESEHFGKKLLTRLSLEPKKVPDWTAWKNVLTSAETAQERIRIAIVGKYVDTGDFILEDSYISVKQSVIHATAHAGVRCEIVWVNAKEFEQNPQSVEILKQVDGVIVPGGFGSSGVEGKIIAINYCRTQKIPFLGLCYGLQLAIVEFARNVCHLNDAHTTEVDPATKNPVITILDSQKNLLEHRRIGGTMRLGAYAATLVPGSVVHSLNETTGRMAKDAERIHALIEDPEKQFRLGFLQKNAPIILERHRHRYEVNPGYIERISQAGLTISGLHTSTNGTPLVEFIEYKDHPYFVATQSHPEFKSRLLDPAPPFIGLANAAKKRAEQRETAVFSSEVQ